MDVEHIVISTEDCTLLLICCEHTGKIACATVYGDKKHLPTVVSHGAAMSKPLQQHSLKKGRFFSGQRLLCFVSRHLLHGVARVALLLTWPEILRLWESQREGSSFQEGSPHFLKDIHPSFFMLLLITADIVFADCLLLQPSRSR